MTEAPQKSESPAATEQFAEQSTNNSGDSATCAEKHKANLKALFALAGHAVHETGDGGFLVCKWGVKHAPDLPALAAFARQLGLRA